MLLPAKFQTPTPAPLGAKVVAIAPAPKPHVHQWVSVPDSKIHSRCAECGTVTLTEIVAPKVVAYAPTAGGQAMLDRVAEINGQIAQAMGMLPTWIGVDPAVPGSDRTVFSEHFMAKPAPAPAISDSDLLRETVAFLDGSDDRRLAGAHARSVLAEMGFKKTINIPQHRRAEFLKALTTWPQEPTKHYTSITAPDGKVRMVETDTEGWIKSDGTQPVADDVRVEVRFDGTDHHNLTYTAKTFVWRLPTHWRPAA